MQLVECLCESSIVSWSEGAFACSSVEVARRNVVAKGRAAQTRVGGLYAPAESVVIMKVSPWTIVTDWT